MYNYNESKQATKKGTRQAEKATVVVISHNDVTEHLAKCGFEINFPKLDVQHQENIQQEELNRKHCLI